MHGKAVLSINCLFIKCFDYKILIDGDCTHPNHTTLWETCTFEKLNDKDIKEIREIISDCRLRGEYKYNRKLNIICQVEKSY